MTFPCHTYQARHFWFLEVGFHKFECIVVLLGVRIESDNCMDRNCSIYTCHRLLASSIQLFFVSNSISQQFTNILYDFFLFCINSLWFVLYTCLLIWCTRPNMYVYSQQWWQQCCYVLVYVFLEITTIFIKSFII